MREMDQAITAGPLIAAAQPISRGGVAASKSSLRFSKETSAKSFEDKIFPVCQRRFGVALGNSARLFCWFH